MMGIYAIKNKIDGKMYVGKSTNIKSRFSKHKSDLKKDIRPIDCNRHLFNAVKKYGIMSFLFFVLEEVSVYSDQLLSEKELYWMDFYKTNNRACGYNLRRDSSTKCFVHEETIAIMKTRIGDKNPNYKKNWSDEKKKIMSDIAKDRHASGVFYNEKWKEKISKRTTAMWSKEENVKKMAKNVSLSKRKYDFYQYLKNGVFVKKWESVEDIVFNNPGYKWQNIYSVCGGYKPSYMGFIWKKELKADGR